MAINNKQTKIFRSYGIEVRDGKLVSPIGLINPVLKRGNTKVGRNVWTWSTLPTNNLFSTEFGIISGTCKCSCEGCYGMAGHYQRANVKRSLAINTLLAYQYLNWLESAILAQLECIGPCMVRIHATGDFFGDEYAEMWSDVVRKSPECKFWTYTKVTKYETLFDQFDNANIVKSIIPEVGYNFGHCDHILHAKNELESRGEEVYICKCGVDDTQHCENCTGCSVNKWVLFLEHSTEYVAKADPLYGKVCEIVNAQEA